MAVNVAVDEDLPILLLHGLVHESLGVVDLGVQLVIRDDPLTVKVDACYRTSIVAAHYAVWIHAGDHLDDVVGEDGRVFHLVNH